MSYKNNYFNNYFGGSACNCLAKVQQFGLPIAGRSRVAFGRGGQGQMTVHLPKPKHQHGGVTWTRIMNVRNSWSRLNIG